MNKSNSALKLLSSKTIGVSQRCRTHHSSGLREKPRRPLNSNVELPLPKKSKYRCVSFAARRQLLLWDDVNFLMPATAF
jgi:hypothetical protein